MFNALLFGRATTEAFAIMTGFSVRILGCMALLALLAACSGHQQTAGITPYYPPPHRDYTAPGPKSDPWGPYIVEAAQRFDVPERWVREVMKAESGGRLYENGTLITSAPGAMGLMQVMPETYSELRSRYNLGDDPYEPHDNIMAGTAYLREMYDVYGSPGFLAAYNAGPRRLEDYLVRNKELPLETRRYVAKIGPNITGVEPQKPSGATQFAMYQLPINIPAGPRYPGRNNGLQNPVALADNRRSPSASDRSVQVAALASPLPTPPPIAPQPPAQTPAKSSGGFHLITPAMADTMPARQLANSGNAWAIQVGAYGNESQARTAAETARGQAHDLLSAARPVVGTVHQANATLYRARLAGLSRDTAMQACSRLAKSHNACIVLSPESQS